MAVSGRTTIFAPFFAASRTNGSIALRFLTGEAQRETNCTAATRTFAGGLVESAADVVPATSGKAATIAISNANGRARDFIIPAVSETSWPTIVPLPRAKSTRSFHRATPPSASPFPYGVARHRARRAFIASSISVPSRKICLDVFRLSIGHGRCSSNLVP